MNKSDIVADGLDAARALNFAVLNDMIHTDYCQTELLGGIAEKYADELSALLAPVLEAEKRLHNWPAKLIKRWRQETGRFQDIFKRALAIKVLTLIGNWSYEVILPASGDTFVDAFMDDGRNEPDMKGSHTVKLILAPGLCRYRQMRELDDRNGFRKPSSTKGEGVEVIRKCRVELMEDR
jgi:hypothetical protein